MDDGFFLKTSSPWWSAAETLITNGGSKQQPVDSGSNVRALLADLKSCIEERDLWWGRRIHAKAVESQDDSHIYIVTTLVGLYSKCGCMFDAHPLFDSIQTPDEVSWNALLSGYVENGEGRVALDLFARMKADGCPPGPVTYISALKACMSLAESGVKDDCLERGRAIHLEIGSHLNLYVQNTLVSMYSKCGSTVEAKEVFDSIQKPDVVSWNALLAGYADNREENVALGLFSKMKASGCVTSSVTYLAVLRACMFLAMKVGGKEKAECLERGKQIHSEIGSHLDRFVQGALIDMYAKFGDMADARAVFDSIEKPDAVSWNTLLLGYVENGEGNVALEMFSRMKLHGCKPDSAVYVAALKACTSLALTNEAWRADSLAQGRSIHAEIGCMMNHFVESALIDMYAKCGSMVDARAVFDSMKKPDVVSWTTLLLGYVENGEGCVVLDMFSKMKESGCAPNSVTYIAALKACTIMVMNDAEKEVCLELGRDVHSEIGCHMNHYVQAALIDMYAKCSSMVEARDIFDSVEKPDLVCWSTLILGYAEDGQGLVALELFSRMEARGFVPDSVAYVAALKACTSVINGLEKGREIHSNMGSILDRNVQSTLIDMYSKCGSMLDARKVFDNIENPDVVSWNALLLGYAENGQGEVALDLFSTLKTSGYAPAPVSATYMAVIKACTSMAAKEDDSGKEVWLKRGRQIHIEASVYMNQCLQATLVNMYARCGSMAEARAVFDSIERPDVVSWTALLLGYAENGEGQRALDMFYGMKASGCVPGPLTYISALKACTSLAVNENASGQAVECGRKIHSEIGCHLEHRLQSTLVDMYAKCGNMLEARFVFDSISKPDVVSWTALLLGYVDNGEANTALDVFAEMKEHGCSPDSLTYFAVFKSCSVVGALALGRKFHTEIREFNPLVLSSIVDFYAKCGSMVEAREVFDLNPSARNVTTWNTLLGGYGRFGDTDSVFKLLEEMKDAGFRPDAAIFVCVLLCCSHAGLVQKAREFFEEIPIRYSVVPSIMHYTCMVDAYGRANQLNEAIFLLRRMSCKPDAVTWRTLLAASCRWKKLEIGKMAFESLASLDHRSNASAHLLMAYIFGRVQKRITAKVEASTL